MCVTVKMELDKFFFRSPSTCLIVGSTGSGKTWFIFNILSNRAQMFEKMPTKILYCFNTYQEKFDKYSNFIEFHKNLPDKNFFDDWTSEKNKLHKIIIIDDLMSDMNDEISKLFTVYSHHKNITVFFLLQNLFFQHKVMRTITLNTQYIVLFNLKRDISQIRVLASQLFPAKENKEFQIIYKNAVSKPFSYLVIDIHPANTYRVALRENIFPNEIEIVHLAK